MAEKKNSKLVEKGEAQIEKSDIKRPLLNLGVKFLVLCLIVGGVIYYSDSKGYFNPDMRNNHTVKKWNAFYDFTEKQNVDVVLLGNSHLYTGINPKNLSATLGANAFILASPGTNIADSYFGLKEALKRTNPKVVVMETYGMNDFLLDELSTASLSEQFKSFSARKDFMTKVISMPQLFRSKDYLYAWSNTLRNHDFIFTNPEQLEKNKKIIKDKPLQVAPQKTKLHLGRYVRFTTGIEDSILNKYKTDGAPVDGAKYKYTSDTKKYVDKIVALCEEENVELIFLTLPMYKDHIKNYSVWKNKLGEILNPHPTPWLNMQDPYSEDFGPIGFENAYQENQHMTYQGSLIASYKLAEFIKKNLKIELPNRKKEKLWYNTFYGEEGFFENNTPHGKDKENKVICQGKKFKGLQLDQVLFVSAAQQNKVKNLIVKINRNTFKGIDPKNTRLTLAVKFIDKGQPQVTQVNLSYDYMRTPTEYAIFSRSLSPINIVDVVDASIVRLR